jgi:membrane-associated phospholipid phosphatase
MCIAFFTCHAQQDTSSILQKSRLTEQNDSSNNYAAQTTDSNERVYKLKRSADIPIFASSAVWSIYAFTKIYNKDRSTEAKILSLNKNDINSFDRWAADLYSSQAVHSGDFLLIGSMPLPLILLFDKKIQKDFWEIGFLYLEAESITQLLYTGAVYSVDRYRPFAYNTNVPMSERTRGGAKNSFFAGHVAQVATSTFFVASVYSAYHPESKIKWLLYTAAAGATFGIAYLRLQGGQHFPSDLLIGIAVGTLSGILVPHFHKNKEFKNSHVSISPFTGKTSGLSLVYKL